MKLFIFGDTHGPPPKNLSKNILKHNFDICLSAGDVNYSDKIRKVLFSKEVWEQLRDGKKLEDIIPVEQYLRLQKESINGMQSSINFLENLGVPVYLIWGNNDTLHTHKLQKKFGLEIKSLSDRIRETKNIKLISNRNFFKLGDYYLIALSGYYGTMDLRSFKPKDRKRYRKKHDKFKNSVDYLFRRTPDKSKTIFLAHNTPYGHLDKINYPASPRHGEHVGNRYTAQAIKRHQPPLYVCGHMHENQGVAHIGNTTIVNGGYGKMGEYAIVELANGKVKDVKLIKGEKWK